ncbi:MAG: diguanylate cyclase [Deltaproteobacteria bacterium]|nr:diguanylate cyclase [Deltaproteobacteria bacterium]
METSRERKVLIVDDDPLIVEMSAALLASEGHSTRQARTGLEACETVRSWHPDVILLDISLPIMNGIEACMRIREMQLPHRPSIIMISSISDKAIIADTLLKGADDFITKPFIKIELSARVAAQIRLVDMYKSLDADRRNLKAVLEVTNSIGSSLNTASVLSTIVGRVAEITSAIRCSIVLISTNNDGYVLASHENPELRDLKIDLSKYPEIQQVMKTKKPLALNDIALDPIMSGVQPLVSDLKGMSVLVLPIITNEEVLGTLFLRARRLTEGFSSEEISICQIIANASYNAIRNARLFETVVTEREILREISITDQLTGLYNHNFFFGRLEEEFDRAVRYENNLSLLMIDIDNFKGINDRYGHLVGDKVLSGMSELIKKCVRKSDLVARYGGEEFSVILPQTPLDGALTEADKIRASIAEHSYGGVINEKVTVSIGVAALPHKTIVEPVDLVNIADRALYRAKGSGKNRVLTEQTN